MSKSPINIIGYEEDANLRTVGWNQGFLDRVKREYNLQHGHAVLFVNKAQDRFRLVACFYNLAVLVLPPTEAENRLSIYLKVSLFLRKFSNKFSDALELLDRQIEKTETRIKRRSRLAKKIKSRRNK